MADELALVRQAYEGFGRGDIETVLASFDPGIEWHPAEHQPLAEGGPHIGPQAVATAVFARVPGTFGDDFRLDIERMTPCGDVVVVQGRYSGTAPATGRGYDVQFAHVLDLAADGRITRYQEYTDTWVVAEVTGTTLP